MFDTALAVLDGDGDDMREIVMGRERSVRASTSVGAGRFGDRGRRWWLDAAVTQAMVDAAVEWKARLLVRTLGLTGLWSATPSVVEVGG